MVWQAFMRILPTSSCLAALALTGCLANLGGPRFRDSRPPPLPFQRASVPPPHVLLITPDMTSLAFEQRSYLFRLKLTDENLLPDAVSALPSWMKIRPLGDLRTIDTLLSKNEYRALRCGWGYPLDFAIPQPIPRDAPFCYVGDIDRDRSDVRAIVAGQLSGLMRQAATIGANVVDEVRCFASEDRSRLWCEGIASLSDSIPDHRGVSGK
ncbi:MAG: hypothetical protein NVSMB1_00480 [Polyangiales bacterium]